MNLNPTPKGWECPKCGKVWAPSIPCCDCHKQKASSGLTYSDDGASWIPVQSKTTDAGRYIAEITPTFQE